MRLEGRVDSKFAFEESEKLAPSRTLKATLDGGRQAYAPVNCKSQIDRQ
jgi:hypothetical protein